MRNILLGTLAGLAIGTVSALAYSHYFGDGQLLADLQAKLDAANATLAKVSQEKQQLAKETSSISDQVDHLLAANDDLKKQVANVPSPAAAPAPSMNAATLAGMMAGMFRGGGFQTQQRLFLLQTRLHLTPDQAAAIKAAMDADSQARRDVMKQLFANNGKVDPQTAAKANTLDQTLATLLTPDQKTAYQQVQADEKASRADTTATTQVNQMAPLLQLSDTQKDQVVNALYQVQVAAPDPTSLVTNPNAASVIAAQVQATQDALAKILTPSQMALYQQQGQTLAAAGGGDGRRGNRGGGANAGTGGGTGAPATPAPAAAPAQ